MTNCLVDKISALKEINSDMLAAAAAGFGRTADDMVFGEGPQNAKLMLIGEAPGAEEVRQSRPFVGQAGRNLDGFLSVLGLARGDIYITNVVKFRPYKTSAKGRLSNRPPAPSEIACMLPRLMREIEAVAPGIVVTLGNVPLKSVLGIKDAAIGAYHAVPVTSTALSHAFTLFPLYHPASVIYNPQLRETYLEDLGKLKHYIASVLRD
jgi:DNA polymerase